MVEYSVKDNLYAVAVKSVTDSFERLVVAKSLIYFIIITCIVTVFSAFKYRVEHYGVNSKLLIMVYPLVDFIKSVLLFIIVHNRSTAETQRVDIVDNTFVNETHDT